MTTYKVSEIQKTLDFLMATEEPRRQLSNAFKICREKIISNLEFVSKLTTKCDNKI